MLGQITSRLRGGVPYSNTYAELSFGTVVVDVDAEEVIGRHGHFEVIAQPFWTAVTAMVPAVPVSQVVAVQIVLLFPVVSMQDVRLRWLVQVGYSQIDGFLQGAQVHLHVAGCQFQFGLQGFAVLARGIFDQVAAEVPVYLQQVTQVPGDLTIGQSAEPKVPFVGTGIDVVQFFQHLSHECFAVGDTRLDGFCRRHVAPLQVVQRFLPMLGVLQSEISQFQEIDPTLFLFGVVALRAVGLEERRDGGSCFEMGFTLFGLGFRQGRFWDFAKGKPNCRKKEDRNYSSQVHALAYKDRCRSSASQSLVV